jgi:dihydroorotase
VPQEFDLVIEHGLLALPSGPISGSLGIRDGRIAAIVDPTERLVGARQLDARGAWVLPGIVDIHVHFRDPGFPDKEDFGSGTRAAARGGVTTVGDMPNNAPPITTAARLVAKQHQIAAKAHVDYVLWGGGVDPSEVDGLVRAGAVGIKIYLTGPAGGARAEPSVGSSPYSTELFVGDDDLLRALFDRAAAADVLVAVHLASPRLEASWRSRREAQRFEDVADALRSESRIDKVEAAERCIAFAQETGARLHIVHVSAAVLPLVARAKASGTRVTAESFAPFMSTELMSVLGPLGFDRYRRPNEIEALWDAMRSGVVDNLATDHAPHTLSEKLVGLRDILSCPSGYPELETILPMVVDEVLSGRLTLDRMVQLMCQRPAELVGIHDRKGRIAIGLDADVALVDPNAEWIVRAEDFATRSKWSPFEGRRGRGRIRTTVLRGEPIVHDGEVRAAPGQGRFLVPTRTRAEDRLPA